MQRQRQLAFDPPPYIEARQVHAGDAGRLLQQCERLEDGVFLIAHHDEHNRQIMLGGRPYRLY